MSSGVVAGGRLPWTPRAGDLVRLREAEGRHPAFLVHRDAGDAQRITPLDPAVPKAVIGRRGSCDVTLEWDERVSRTHAELERVGGEWILGDEGLSRNGTFLNGERIAGRRRLRDWDLIRVGRTTIVFRSPGTGSTNPTLGTEAALAGPPTPAQRRVLVALCRPCLGGAFAAPTSNEGIAAELGLSLDAVKGHLRALFTRFGVGDLPHNQKRLRLVQLAIESGAVTRRDADTG